MSRHRREREGRKQTHLPKRDVIATALVAVAGLLYLLWAMDSALPSMSSTRATGVAILALGFAASASAVVPGFHQLLHGNKTYLVITSLIGAAAFAAGVQMLVRERRGPDRGDGRDGRAVADRHHPSQPPGQDRAAAAAGQRAATDLARAAAGGCTLTDLSGDAGGRGLRTVRLCSSGRLTCPSAKPRVLAEVLGFCGLAGAWA